MRYFADKGEKCPNKQRAITHETFFQNFIQKLTRSSTHHYQSIHQVSRSSSNSFLDILLTGKNAQNYKGQQLMKHFSEFIQKLIWSSIHHYQSIHQVSRRFNSFGDILLTREKCPNLKRAITQEIFFRIYSKDNQVIYSSLSINLPSFKVVASAFFFIYFFLDILLTS